MNTAPEFTAPPRVARWDNPVPMECDSESTSRFASWHITPCHRNADWVLLDGDTVTRFLCDRCRQQEGFVVRNLGEAN